MSDYFLRLFKIFIIPFFILFTIIYIFPPYWNTNDDVGMSMRAHGYGIGSIPTAFIQNSNVVWGYFIQILPSDIFGIPGYSFATYLIIYIFLMSVCLFVVINKINKEKIILIFLTILLISFRPIISPQFTINAGLITIAGFIFLKIYFQLNSIKYLIISFICFFLGFIIRENMFFAISFVALSFIANRDLIFNRKIFFFSLLLISILIGAKNYNNYSYNTGEMKKYSDFQKARLYWKDYYGFLRVTDDVLTKHQFSRNDVRLLNYWFFADPYLADAERLNTMRADMPPRLNLRTISRIKKAIGYLWEGQAIFPLSLCAFLILIFCPSLRLRLSWLSLLIILIYLAYLGRVAIDRIYLPLIILLIVIPLLEFIKKDVSKKKVYIMIAIFFICNNLNFYSVIHNHSEINEKSKDFHQEDFNFLNKVDYFVSFGGAFPYLWAYPVIPRKNFGFRIYGLGTSFFNPYSVSQIEENNNNGLIKQLKSDEGLIIWSNKRFNSYLAIYCLEHHNKNLTSIKIKEQYDLHQVWCN